MLIYFGLLIFCIISGFICFNKRIKSKNLYMFLTFVAMFLVMGFRAETVGTDTKLYCNWFEYYGAYDFAQVFKTTTHASLVYGIYNKLVSLISLETGAIILANSFIIALLTVIFIKNNSKYVVLSTILFVTFYHFFNAMNIARQYIAVLLIANSFYFFKNKQIVKYILMCLLATLVHTTAIVGFALLPFMFIKIDRKSILIYLLVVSIFALFCFNGILELFAQVFSHYGMYFTDKLLEETGQNRKIIITVIYIFFEFIMYILLKRKDLKEEERKRIKLYFIYNSLAIIIGFISLKIMLLSRIEFYFSILAIIYIPELLSYFKEKNFYNYAFTLMMFVPMLAQMLSNHAGILPYVIR